MVSRGNKLLITVALLCLHSSVALGQFGVAITAPMPLNTTAFSDAGMDSRPHIATDGAGNWVAVWYSHEDLGGTLGSDADILVARSTDNGATWTAPDALNTNAAVDERGDYEPYIATDRSGHWVTVWRSSDNLGGTIDTDSDILVARSGDNGASWTFPEPLNSHAAIDVFPFRDDAHPQVAADGSGSWVTVWHSNHDLGGTVGTDFDILFARSSDDGATWTSADALTPDASTDSGPDASPHVTVDASGTWLAAWTAYESGGMLGDDYDLLVARSGDGGSTWTDPQPLNTTAAADLGQDYDARFAGDGVGNWLAVWYSDDDLGGAAGTDADIFFALSTDAGVSWSAPDPLNTNADSDLVVQDSLPDVGTDRSGNWVAAWYSWDPLAGDVDNYGDMLVARSADGGFTWTDPEPLHPDSGDHGGDERPHLATDALGNWVAVWYSVNDLGATIGMDRDILVTQFVLPLLGGSEFVRGDCNADGSLDIADAIQTLDSLFGAGLPVGCLDACDANDDGALDISDPIYFLAYLFVLGAAPPPEPFPMCGVDGTLDVLACAAFALCP